MDALKIAGEFTQEGESETVTRSTALAAAIVAMARSLGIETVAEGIETPAQAERMRALACTYGQGFFFARPLPAEEVADVARETAAAAATGAETDAAPAPTQPRLAGEVERLSAAQGSAA